MKANIVVGLGFGDEGKGITTDFLCRRSQSKKIVVRFCGGHQAGHTVEFEDISHVFSNFGSGTMADTPTYFTEHTVIYPITLLYELDILNSKGFYPELYIHPLAKLATPMDGIFNRIQESINNHGSCGVGIGATMKRHIETPYKLFAVDLLNFDLLEQKLFQIKKYYENILSPIEKNTFNLNLKLIMPNYLEQVKKFNEVFKGCIVNYTKLYDYNEIIFEGAQGIMLDMDHGIFPNVTYANTTRKNAMEVCNLLGIKDIDVYYITRCYQTRHGNGWMSSNDGIRLINNEKETNVFNEWQKNFRIAELDYNLLNYALSVDNSYGFIKYKNLVITCLDQRPDFIFDFSKINFTFKKIVQSYSRNSKDFKILNKLL